MKQQLIGVIMLQFSKKVNDMNRNRKRIEERRERRLRIQAIAEQAIAEQILNKEIKDSPDPHHVTQF